jgi:ribosomal protein S18 acetylase RimI-like enzyme
MKLNSLGYRSQLIFAEFDGLSADRGDHWAIHTLSNPNFFWGNLLIFDRPPRRGDYASWTRLFRQEFTNPNIYHVTLAWDSSAGEVGDVSEFMAHGFLLESTAVLTAKKVIRPPKFNESLEVREIQGEKDWKTVLALQLASAHEHLTHSQWEDYYKKQFAQYQAMEKDGFGHFYGAFLDGTLVASLGIFHRNGVGRFQLVSTDPKFQRQGCCQTLVYISSQLALGSGQIENLVMCADPDYHAIKIYESVGFKRQQLEHGVYWWDKSRAP